MDVNSVNSAYTSLYTAASLARAAQAEQGQAMEAEAPERSNQAPSRPPTEDREVAVLMERSQYQASLNARLGLGLYQSHAAGTPHIHTGPPRPPAGSPSQDPPERAAGNATPAAEMAAASPIPAAAPQAVGDERVVLTQTGVSLTGLVDQVTRVLAGAMGELLGDVQRLQGTAVGQHTARNSLPDRRLDLYRHAVSSPSAGSRLDVSERRF